MCDELCVRQHNVLDDVVLDCVFELLGGIIGLVENLSYPELILQFETGATTKRCAY